MEFEHKVVCERNLENRKVYEDVFGSKWEMEENDVKIRCKFSHVDWTVM